MTPSNRGKVKGRLPAPMVSVIRSLSRDGWRAEHQLRQRIFVGPDVAAVVPDGRDALRGQCVHRHERTGQPQRAADDLGTGGEVAVLGHRDGQPCHWRSARPMTSSLRPEPYSSAVSTKLMPRRKAWCSVRMEALSSTAPQSPPNCQPPKAISLTCHPVRPKVRYCIGNRSPSSMTERKRLTPGGGDKVNRSPRWYWHVLVFQLIVNPSRPRSEDF